MQREESLFPSIILINEKRQVQSTRLINIKNMNILETYILNKCIKNKVLPSYIIQVRVLHRNLMRQTLTKLLRARLLLLLRNTYNELKVTRPLYLSTSND